MESAEIIYHVTGLQLLQLTFCSISLQQKQKLKVVAKDSTGWMFQFRNDLLWTRLGGNYFLWAKGF